MSQRAYQCVLTGMFTMVLASSVALGQQVLDTAPSANNSIYQESDNSNGLGDNVFVGNTTSNNARRALLRFDISAIPPGAQVQSVALHMHVTQASPDGPQKTQIALHRLTAQWGEGASRAEDPGGEGAPPTMSAATWNSSFHLQMAWTTPGGDFAATTSATATAGGNDSAVVWDDEALIEDVQGWVDGTLGNHGWILVGDEVTASTARRLASRNNPTQANRPRLVVEYAIAEVPTPSQTPEPDATPTETPEPQATPTYPAVDINRDGVVDHKDLMLFIQQWQQQVEQTPAP